MVKRNKPSTKSRREGYAKLNRLLGFLHLLYFNKRFNPPFDGDPFNNWIEEVSELQWRDYMVRHIPESKRGGPDKP